MGGNLAGGGVLAGPLADEASIVQVAVGVAFVVVDVRYEKVIVLLVFEPEYVSAGMPRRVVYVRSNLSIEADAPVSISVP